MLNSAKIFEDFNQLQVLVVGDVMIDRYLQGSVDRISPEAPVPVVKFHSTDNRLGGAANVALNIKALGATPYLCSVIGQDENTAVFMDLLPKNDLSDLGIHFSKERMTTVKTRVIAQSQQMLRVDREDNFALSAKEEADFLHLVQGILTTKKIDVILFQDYNKGVLTPKVIQTIIRLAQQHNIPTAVDPKNQNFLTYKNVTLFKPNLKEVRQNIPLEVHTNVSSLTEAANYIHRHLENKYTLITLSEKGLFLHDQEKATIIPTQARNIADVCGAGDTVISVAALGLALSLDMKEVSFLANLAGGQVCERVGVVPVHKAQLKKEFDRHFQIN
ncbi:MAG: bifunctional heptose 7-phosphate kinase/heptose 1-phosphate adenyltransferase [Saprospiraceae bacterium]